MTEQDRAERTAPSRKGRSGMIRKALRWIAISVGGLLATVTLIVVVVVVFGIPIDLSALKGKIETAAADALGRPVSIEGPLTLVPSMPPAAQIEGVHIGNPAGWPEADLARLDLARAELRVLPLLDGEVLIEEITVEGLHVNLETNAAGEPNWLLEKPQEEREPKPKPEKEAAPRALKFIELAELSLSNIAINHRNAATGRTFALTLDQIRGSAEVREPMDLLIQGSVQDVPYKVTFNAGSLASLFEGKESWPLDVTATVVDTRLTIVGDIAEPLRGRGLALEFELTGAQLKSLEAILGTRLPPVPSFGLEGRIEEAEGRYRIADLKGQIETTTITGSFQADTSGAKPRLDGKIDIRSIDVGPFFAAITEQGPLHEGAAAPPEQRPGESEDRQAARPLNKIDLDEPVLILEPLSKFDAQFELSIHEVINAPTSLRDASLKVTVSDGRLATPVAVVLAEVPFRGKLELGLENDQPKVAVSLAGEKSDIGELAMFIMGAEGIEGKFDVARLDFSASGETVRSLVETAELRAAIAGASLSYGHDTDGHPVEFTLDEASLLFPASSESRITARGSLLGEALALEIEAGTFIENFVQKRWPLKLNAQGGGAQLGIEGTVQRPQGDLGSELTFNIRGKRFGDLATWLGVSPKAKQPYALRGKASHSEQGLLLQIDEARIGASRFGGQAGARKDGETRITFAKLDFDVLSLKELKKLFAEQPQTGQSEPVDRKVGREALTIGVPILPTGIEIFDSDIDIAIARIVLERVEITRVSLSSRIRDGHVDKAPIGATIGEARFEGDFGMDLRNDVPEVDFAIRSSQVDVGLLMAQLGVVEGLEMSAGGFQLDLAMAGASTREILQRSSFNVAISDGLWRFSAPGAEGGLDIGIPAATISVEPQQPIALTVDGRIDEIPVQIEITTDSLASFAEPKERLKMDLGIALLQAELKLTGAAPLPVQAHNLQFAMDLSGKRFSDFNELLDVSLPPIGPYRLQGGFGTRQSGFYVEKLQVTVGESTLTGALDLQTAQIPPRLDVDLVAERIQLDDFKTGDWSVTQAESGTTEASQTRDPERRQAAVARARHLLSPSVMRSLNGQVEVEVAEVLSGEDQLGRGTMTAALQDGRFSVDPLNLQIPGGSVEMSFALEPTDTEVALETTARIERLDYGILARRIDPSSEIGGVISVDVDLSTRGPDLKRVLHGANGHIDFGLWPKDRNAEIFELWAVNVIGALVSEMDKEEASKLNCVIVRFQVEDGVMRDRVVFADTSKMRVEGTAEIDFKQRTLQVKAKPKAKRPEFFSLAVPVGLSGEFEDFDITVNPVVVGGQAVSFVTSPVHVPLRRIFKKGEPEDGKQACALAWSTVEMEAGDDEVPEQSPEE